MTRRSTFRAAATALGGAGVLTLAVLAIPATAAPGAEGDSPAPAVSVSLTAPRLEGPQVLEQADGPADGVVLVYGVHLSVPSGTVLAVPAEPYAVGFDATGVPGARVLGCGANGAPEAGIAYSAVASGRRTQVDVDPAGRLADGGVWVCPSGAATTTATVTDVTFDATLGPAPTHTWDGTPLPADPAGPVVVSAGAVRVWVPVSALGDVPVTATVVAGPVTGGDPVAGAVTATRSDPLTATQVGVAAPALTAVQAVNGRVAPTAPGVSVAPGEPLEWRTTVVNTGSVPLVDLRAMVGGAVVSTSSGPLAPGQAWVVTQAGVQPAGALVHTVVVTARTIDGAVTVTRSHDAVSTAADPVAPVAAPAAPATVVAAAPEAVPAPEPAAAPAGLANDKTTLAVYVNAVEFTALPGPVAIVGKPNLLEYEVTNKGATTLTNVVVEDSSITNDATAIDCFIDTVNKNRIASLGPNETVTCERTVTPSAGANVTFTATVTVAGAADATLNAGFQPMTASIDLELAVNGQDADTAPGASVIANSVLTFTYVLRNTGQVDLANATISHRDDDEGEYADIACAPLGDDTDGDSTIDLLKAGQSVNCTLAPRAKSGAVSTTAEVFANLVTAEGDELSNADGPFEVSDADAVNYVGGGSTGGSTTGGSNPSFTTGSTTGTVTATPTIANGGAESGRVAMVAGAVFGAGFGLWVLARRRRPGLVES